MKHFLFYSICILLIGNYCQAQQIFPTVKKNQETPAFSVELNEAVVVEKRTFLNDTLRYNYNQMRYYVKTILPYLDASVKMFNEIDLATKDMNKKNRRKYIKSREKEIEQNFEGRLKQLNITQGRYLIKLINRQLSINCYDIVKELKNPVTAAYYQGWAKLNGINLNEDYDPNKERDLESIMRNLGY